ncbi:MAG: hypothetical protein U0744_12280 [Gemmataceae bacterium]
MSRALPLALTIMLWSVASGSAFAPAVDPKGDEARVWIQGILVEWRSIPPTFGRAHLELHAIPLHALPTFSRNALSAYAESDSFDAARKRVASKPEDYPLRKTFFDVLRTMEESHALTLANEYQLKNKQAFAKAQGDVAQALYGLEQAAEAMKEAEKQRDREQSKRWQAHFDYAHARLLRRIAHLYEYNMMIGQIRTERLPDFDTNLTGWKLHSTKNMACRERKARDAEADARALFAKIAEAYPETPWAWLARREADEPLGLEWRTKSE